MKLAIQPPYAPMEARLVDRIPTGTGWLYEPKWDGFRCLVFRDGDEVVLQSKAGKPLQRYFPEVVRDVLALAPRRFVLDGEIVVPVQGLFSFDDLQQRIHPAVSRINRLARETPARLILFDLLVAADGTDMTGEALFIRRRHLEEFARQYLEENSPIGISEAVADAAAAEQWLAASGANLDGVIAKRLEMAYRSGERMGMQKIKKRRTADCVIGGFRYSSSSFSGTESAAPEHRQVGSLLLGLYDDQGLLHHVGFCSGLNDQERRSLVKQLEALIAPPGFTGNAPGGPSRWSTARSGQWQPLAPRLVVEVQWDHFTGGRFRHGTRLLRWRPDKSPRQCTMEQVRLTASA
jgi:ATP-dependent DNA ligase